MQEKHMDELLKESSEQGHSELAITMKMDMESQLAMGLRTPTEEEVKQMRQFIKDYRRKSPKASSRNIRRALLRKFNIQVLPNNL